MNTQVRKKIGVWLLASGLILLVAGIALAFAVHVYAVLVVLVLSVLLNTAGITALRRKD